MGFQGKGAGDKSGYGKADNTTLKIKIRGKDDAPLSMTELCDGVLDAMRQLKRYEPDYRIKFTTIYLRMVDEDGTPVRINDTNELTIFPYKVAAEEYGL